MNYGEIITLGRHVLMCGDARKPEDVHALVEGRHVDLVLTDPPYGINVVKSGGHFQGHWGDKRLRQFGYKEAGIAPHFDEILGDTSQDSARENYHIVRGLTDRLIIWGGQYFADFLPISGAWIIWDKLLNMVNYSACELAWTSSLRNHNVKYSHRWSGFTKQGSRTLNPTPRVHPTQKPVELHAHILEDFSHEGDVILDCFGGSGTTLIAAEITGRTCLMMEFSPEYCDVIINRYNKLTEGSFNYERNDSH